MANCDKKATAALVTALALVAAGCADQRAAGPAELDVRGSNPNATAGAPAGGPRISADGNIVVYDGYEAARAQQGDTVEAVANRVGLSASELGSYNGLSPNHPLQPGDELVLPPRPGGYAALEAQPAPGALDDAGATLGVPRVGGGATGLGTNGTGTPGTGTSGTGIEQGSLDGTQVASAGPGTEGAGAPGGPGWSPDLAAAAIERANGLEENGDLAAPPSAGDPLPQAPRTPAQLQSPDLSQYQTPGAVGLAGQGTQTIETDQAAQAADDQAANQLALSNGGARPALGDGFRLSRPVDGPVAVGYRAGVGANRNDGIDFAAAAGSPVSAAAEGEVALVSKSLGGLGTIVLIRHRDEILTVYGRLADVTVTKGDTVSRGQQIGTVAPAPAPQEPRLHFELRRGAESIDPTSFITS